MQLLSISCSIRTFTFAFEDILLKILEPQDFYLYHGGSGRRSTSVRVDRVLLCCPLVSERTQHICGIYSDRRWRIPGLPPLPNPPESTDTITRMDGRSPPASFCLLFIPVHCTWSLCTSCDRKQNTWTDYYYYYSFYTIKQYLEQQTGKHMTYSCLYPNLITFIHSTVSNNTHSLTTIQRLASFFFFT